MGNCFYSNRTHESISIDTLPTTEEVQPSMMDEIVDVKHAKYMNTFEGKEELFWAMGIENESYFMLKTLLGVDFFKKLQRKRERYSVDYYKNFEPVALQRVFDALYECPLLTYPIYINSHSFQSADTALEHRTLYDANSTPNPKFREALHEILLRECAYYKDVFSKSVVFDGDSIEFITQNFYKTTVAECVQELTDLKQRFLQEIAPYFKRWRIGDLQYPDHNYGLVSFLSTYKRNVSVCNNGTIHINFTLPTLLKNGSIVDKPSFVEIHMKAARAIQLVEPLLVACYGTPDLFSLVDPSYSMGSLRVSLSRYISIQTYDTRSPKNGKLLLMKRPGAPQHWYNRMSQSPYVINEEIGYDINFNKFKNHGIELRFFDWFPEEYLTDVIHFILLLCQHSMVVDSTDFVMDAYQGVIKRCLQKGFTCFLTAEECTLFLRDLKLDHCVSPLKEKGGSPHQLLSYIAQCLYEKYHRGEIIHRMAPHMNCPVMVNYNELACKQMYADLYGKPDLILRTETNPKEHRTPLIPQHMRALEPYFRLRVESSSTRCYTDKEYEEAGATIVSPHYWSTVPHAYVIGLKDLPLPTLSTQTHLYFAHCFNQQQNYLSVLKKLGTCTFIDYETMTDAHGRVISFCRQSGKIGCYLALMSYYCQTHDGMSFPAFHEPTYQELLSRASWKPPRVLLIGYGTVGRACKEVLDRFGIDCTVWTSKDEKRRETILQYDILLNAIRIKPDHKEIFLQSKDLDRPNTNLRVICDMSCDMGHPQNPLPLYTEWTDPIARIRSHPPLDLIAINNLPSLEPIVSSNAFSSILKDYLPELHFFKYTHESNEKASILYQSYQRFLTCCHENREALHAMSPLFKG
jgi:alanine dehydrogenase